ncbi:NUDIX domain-containing protein [Streptomyces litchfieldiae]|uniref:NUDIX domain-containing protein n=1 Tax=Streptomyces litchfieldiae TaxID=3075543 RepID=A0ABU2MT46_9ACTN|nr:NUDIX domain-containing protein [Streptomyces sp. DSM 44938]MDT0344249.1 NUDIX domain-containing protein [Streptomyces sp. DSM 44938]
MVYTYGRTVTHCPFCGAGYPATVAWPRDCPGCGETHWANPLPVAVALLPVAGPDGPGVVVVRRDIEPCRGELALPGGYMEIGETWQQAAVRELREETGLTAPAAEATLFDVRSGDRTLNLFALLPPREAATLPASTATPEATEWLVLTKPAPLAFPSHTEVLEAYFAGR